MSDSCKRPNFESIGTIHYRVSCTESCLFFVPDSNHYLKYSDKSYAAFVRVPPPEDKDGIRDALAVPLLNNENSGIVLDKSVPIEIPNCNKTCDKMRVVLQVALQAAQNETKVTVTVTKKEEKEVEEERKKKPGCSIIIIKLVGITFPAR